MCCVSSPSFVSCVPCLPACPQVIYKTQIAIFDSAGGSCIGCVLLKELVQGSVQPCSSADVDGDCLTACPPVSARIRGQGCTVHGAQL